MDKGVHVVFRGMGFDDMLDVQALNIRNSAENFLLSTFLSTLHESRNTSFVAESGGCIVGYIEAVACADEMAGHIYSLCVDQCFRGIGIGKKLISLYLQTVKEELFIGSMPGTSSACMQRIQIDLHVSVTNLNAIRLYESFGFLAQEQPIPYYENNGLAYRMCLWI